MPSDRWETFVKISMNLIVVEIIFTQTFNAIPIVYVVTITRPQRN
jgi:hypothetical protein